MSSRNLPNPLARRRAWLRPLAMVLALLLGLTLILTAVHRSRQAPAAGAGGLQHSQNHFERLTDFEAAAAGAGISRSRPEPVRIGLEISNLYNLDLPQQTFMANGYFWLRWPQTVQTWMEQEGIEPARLIHFTNNIVSYDLLIEPNGSRPRLRADGWREQTFLFSGHFWIEQINFKDFPFQRLQIPIRMEVRPEEFALNGPRPIALLGQPLQRGLLGSLIEIPGLVLEGGRLDPYVARFDSDAASAGGDGSESYSQVLATAFFHTHHTTSIGQWLLPILIVMLTVFVAPSVSGRLSEMRIAVPSAALLTLVVMQQTYEATIPPLSYLTFLDLIYLWCYAVTVGLFILFICSSNQLANINSDAPDAADQAAAITARIDRNDRRFQIGSLIATVVFVLLALQR